MNASIAGGPSSSILAVRAKCGSTAGMGSRYVPWMRIAPLGRSRWTMPQVRTIAAASRELQRVANRLALATRNRDRDVILARLFPDIAKGRLAAERLEANAPALAALEAEVSALRLEVGGLLEQIQPAAPELPDLDLTEPTRKRKKRK